MDEVECVCANLIFRKYVKGYISHKNKVGWAAERHWGWGGEKAVWRLGYISHMNKVGRRGTLESGKKKRLWEVALLHNIPMRACTGRRAAPVLDARLLQGRVDWLGCGWCT